jgi:FKBP-type peptidyl-prolyl cis-trans isomerase 2
MALTLAIAACGSGPTPTPTATPTPQPTPTPTFTTNPAGQRIAVVGNTVSVHYRGTLEDGSEFDTSYGGLPLTFTVGSGQMIPGFDEGVRGMALGEKKTVTIPPEDAYGEVDGTAPQTAPLAQLPEGIKVGDEFEPADGVKGRVLAVFGDYAWVQINHELAGKTLTFEIEVVDIQ